MNDFTDEVLPISSYSGRVFDDAEHSCQVMAVAKEWRNAKRLVAKTQQEWSSAPEGSEEKDGAWLRHATSKEYLDGCLAKLELVLDGVIVLSDRNWH